MPSNFIVVASFIHANYSAVKQVLNRPVHAVQHISQALYWLMEVSWHACM